MKLFSRLLALIVIAALAGPFFIKGPNGEPLWRVDTLWAQAKFQWRRLSGNVVDALPVDQNVEVYRWRNANGQWQFAAEAPPGIEADVLNIDPATNVISLGPLPAEPEVEVTLESAEAPPEPSRGVGPLPDPDATRQLLEDVRAIQGKVDARDQKLRDTD